MLPNVSFGAAAAAAGCDSDDGFADAKDDRVGLEDDPKAEGLPDPKVANADVPEASFPKPDAANALAEVSGALFLAGLSPLSLSFCVVDCVSVAAGF